MAKTLYHYTAGIKLASIARDGYLKLTPDYPTHGEKPVVWLSSNSFYENTALKMFQRRGDKHLTLATMSEMHSYTDGIFRFVFDPGTLPDVLPWGILKHKARIPPKVVTRLLTRARTIEARPSEWYGSLDPLPIQDARLERLDPVTNVWHPASLATDVPMQTQFTIKQVTCAQVPHLRLDDSTWKR